MRLGQSEQGGEGKEVMGQVVQGTGGHGEDLAFALREVRSMGAFVTKQGCTQV